MARDAGHTVMWLPLFQCELNPIVLVWAEVKQEVFSNNTTFKLSDAERLIKEAVDHVTANGWHGCVGHVKKLEKKFRNIDIYINQSLSQSLSPAMQVTRGKNLKTTKLATRM